MKLQHKDGADYTFSKVTVHYDNRIDDLVVDDEGCVEVSNEAQARELLENNDFLETGDSTEIGHVLEDLNVSEVEEYVKDVNDVERLKELRQKETRKTAIGKIDRRIEELSEPLTKNQESEEEDEQTDEVSEEDETESEEVDDEEQ